LDAFASYALTKSQCRLRPTGSLFDISVLARVIPSTAPFEEISQPALTGGPPNRAIRFGDHTPWPLLALNTFVGLSNLGLQTIQLLRCLYRSGQMTYGLRQLA
jgi:hypothetical protein